MQKHSAIRQPLLLASLTLATLLAAANTTTANANPRQVIARVNGQPIKEAQLNAAITRTWFGYSQSQQQIRKTKYERLIINSIISQFLAQVDIQISKNELNAKIEKLKQTPPRSSCSCCRYRNLDTFMRDQGYTMDELRQEQANEIGLAQYISNKWHNLPPGEQIPNAFHRARIQRQYRKASHIFFNIFQHPEFRSNPDAVENQAYRAASQSYRRLTNGEAFETVAIQSSQDAISATEGGQLEVTGVSHWGQS